MHDRIGRELKVGDTVVLLATVTELSAMDEYCNVSIETVYGRRPDGQKERINGINTNVLLKANLDIGLEHAKDGVVEDGGGTSS